MSMSFTKQKLLSFLRFHVLIVDPSTFDNCVLFRKSSSVPISSNLFLTISSVSFNLSGLMLKSYLNLNFVKGDKEVSICILLQASIQLDQYYLLKILSFLVCISQFFLKIQMSICVLIHVWVFISIPLISVSVFFLPISCCFYYNCFVVYLKLDGDAFSNYFISQHCFNYLDFCYFVCFHMKLSIAVSGSVIICVGILIGIYIDSVD